MLDIVGLDKFIATWLYGWQCWSVSCSTTLVQTEISQQLLDGLPWNLMHTFMFPRGWSLLTQVPYSISNATMRSAFLVLAIISQQLLDGLRWHLVRDTCVTCNTKFWHITLLPHQVLYWGWQLQQQTCSDDDKGMIKVNNTGGSLTINIIHKAFLHDDCIHYHHNLKVWILQLITLCITMTWAKVNWASEVTPRQKIRDFMVLFDLPCLRLAPTSLPFK